MYDYNYKQFQLDAEERREKAQQHELARKPKQDKPSRRNRRNRR